MQDEVNQQVVTLVIRGGRISAAVLRSSIASALRDDAKAEAESKRIIQRPADGEDDLKKAVGEQRAADQY